MTKFEKTLQRWQAAQAACVDARLQYEHVYATTLVTASGKANDIRKAQADLAAAQAKRTYEHAQIEAQTLEALVQYLQHHD